MWLLRSLPNNVLCHVGIRHGLKGPNACITNHSVSGPLAIAEAARGARATASANAPSPSATTRRSNRRWSCTTTRVGLLSEARAAPVRRRAQRQHDGRGRGGTRPRDRGVRRGRARRHGARRDPGQRLRERRPRAAADPRRRRQGSRARSRGALDDAGLRPADVGHDRRARQRHTPNPTFRRRARCASVFGAATPPVTALQVGVRTSAGGLGIIETVLALAATARARACPGIANLRRLDPACAGLPVSATPQTPRSDVALRALPRLRRHQRRAAAAGRRRLTAMTQPPARPAAAASTPSRSRASNACCARRRTTISRKLYSRNELRDAGDGRRPRGEPRGALRREGSVPEALSARRLRSARSVPSISP